EVHRERAQYDRLRLDVEGGDRLCERTRGAVVAPSAEPGEQTDPLLEAQHLLALLLGKDLAEDLPEQPDVRAERRVGGAAPDAGPPRHPPPSLGRCRARAQE